MELFSLKKETKIDLIKFVSVFVISVITSFFLCSTFIKNEYNIALAKETKQTQPLVGAAKLSLPIMNRGKEVVADIVEDISPSVVHISTEREVKVPQFGGNGFFFEDDFFKHFFGTDPFQGKEAVPFIQSGTGSGAIISSDGYILTNYHVVKNATKITVKTDDEKEYASKVVGKDKYSDLAVLKIDKKGLKAVKLADSDLIRPGQWAIAMGSPHGLNHTVTLGIISAIRRDVPQLSNVSFIQTDAAINPGNSGGPLLNIKGEVIGINTAIIGGAQNIGFAIPVNTAKSIVNDLKAGKTVNHPWMGIAMSELTPELKKAIGIDEKIQGVIIGKVIPKSPSNKAGLLQGDIIQKIDGKKYTKPEDIKKHVKSKKVGNTINIQILRDDSIMGKKVKLETWGGKD